ncbi:PACE efflux transporter [Leisingera sp. ANG-Vp]|uniref:PACE efflux transporter n=1 Tax=Leisingera sp. ANG-Vp TaxID=1577896 RepID=UPI0009E26C42|nr:PACE efflux transporter [Leisingera sp. ANG-Vp]
MAGNVAMRTAKDRLRYTISFEIFLMAILVPVGAAFFDKPLSDIGLLGAFLSVKAMLLNLLYNWIFDKADAKAGRVSSDRSTLGRLLHATGFEATLLITSLPVYIWWLGLSLWQALATDLTVTSFVVLYTYGFTLAYDRLFPVAAAPASGS